MPYEITTNGFYTDVIEWLQVNVGNVLWSRPVVEWKGQGWTMNSLGETNRLQTGYLYIIRIDEPKLATLAALRWSS